MIIEEDLIDILENIIKFEEGSIKTMPKGCVNSYGYGYSEGQIDAAKRLLNYVKTGVDDYDV